LKTLYFLIALLFTATISISWDYSNKENIPAMNIERIKGITMVAPPKEFSNNPLEPIRNVNANWVALVPYGYTPKGEASVKFNTKWQWWGEKPEGVRKCIQMAHKKGLKVLLKPQVYIHRGWIGEMDFHKEEDWLKWEKEYEKFIMSFLDIAIEEDIDMFCIGTEYKVAVIKREKFWRTLIAKVRENYCGQIIYSANWDSFESVPIWDALDYVGISSYFPLTEAKTPSNYELGKAWKPITRKLNKFSRRNNKKIIFTEYGYLSVDHCADKSWELEKKIKSLDINETGQANALSALYEHCSKEEFWAGGFLWKWFPNMQGHEGYPDKDYTPQGKLAEDVITEWYGKI
jgi:hypothetical protein